MEVEGLVGFSVDDQFVKKLVWYVLLCEYLWIVICCDGIKE